MKTKFFAAFALLAATVCLNTGSALAGTTAAIGPQGIREVGSPPPPMPIRPIIGREVGSPPPPMPILPLSGREVGSPPPPMPAR